MARKSSMAESGAQTRVGRCHSAPQTWSPKLRLPPAPKPRQFWGQGCNSSQPSSTLQGSWGYWSRPPKCQCGGTLHRSPEPPSSPPKTALSLWQTWWSPHGGRIQSERLLSTFTKPLFILVGERSLGPASNSPHNLELDSESDSVTSSAKQE